MEEYLKNSVLYASELTIANSRQTCHTFPGMYQGTRYQVLFSTQDFFLHSCPLIQFKIWLCYFCMYHVRVQDSSLTYTYLGIACYHLNKTSWFKSLSFS